LGAASAASSTALHLCARNTGPCMTFKFQVLGSSPLHRAAAMVPILVPVQVSAHGPAWSTTKASNKIGECLQLRTKYELLAIYKARATTTRKGLHRMAQDAESSKSTLQRWLCSRLGLHIQQAPPAQKGNKESKDIPYLFKRRLRAEQLCQRG
jgi:hypothetical protein